VLAIEEISRNEKIISDFGGGGGGSPGCGKINDNRHLSKLISNATDLGMN
jgi:hypothetical protein